MANLGQPLKQLNQEINLFLNFLSRKLKNFRTISPGEQIAFLLTGLGLVLIVVSVVMFLL